MEQYFNRMNLLNSTKQNIVDKEMKKIERVMYCQQFAISKKEQDAVRDRYKPANLHQAIKLYGSRTEKSTPYNEAEFRLKIREAVLRLREGESGYVEQIFYT